MKSDLEILEKSYTKYKDKTGNKARNLYMRIQSFKALYSIRDKLNS